MVNCRDDSALVVASVAGVWPLGGVASGVTNPSHLPVGVSSKVEVASGAPVARLVSMVVLPVTLGDGEAEEAVWFRVEVGVTDELDEGVVEAMAWVRAVAVGGGVRDDVVADAGAVEAAVVCVPAVTVVCVGLVVGVVATGMGEVDAGWAGGAVLAAGEVVVVDGAAEVVAVAAGVMSSVSVSVASPW